MWLVSSMIISIIKFRFHVQSTAQLNYLLSTIVYVPDSKFTYNVTNALLYSQRISRDLSPPEIVTSAPSENALWVFRMRINASCFSNHIFFQPFRDLISGKICPVDFLMSGFSRAPHRFMVIFSGKQI